jgi:hypothetical protein
MGNEMLMMLMSTVAILRLLAPLILLVVALAFAAMFVARRWRGYRR